MDITERAFYRASFCLKNMYIIKKYPKIITKKKISLIFNSRLDATARKRTPCLLVVIPK